VNVLDGFDRAARSYDRLVGANPGYHAHLRRSARRLRLPPGDGTGLRLLDLGCGTGASTAALLAVAPKAEIVAVDASAGMLAEARRKPWPATVTFVHARAEDLAAAGLRGPFDGVLAAYLVRNLADPDRLLRTVRGLLRPGATAAVHEYSVADSRFRKLVWRAVCATVIVPAGRLLSGDATLYRYLRQSVLEFDGVRAMSARLRRAGFTGVRVEPMSGWQRGIVHTFLGRRPDRPDPSARTDPVPLHTLAQAQKLGQPLDGPSGGPGGDITVAVVGGGIAGVSAAVALAERGVGVVLLEREPHLGGRLAGWPTRLRDGSTVTMSRGFHAFFRQYYNLRGLLSRTDPDLDRLVPVGDYPLQHAGGARDTFTHLPRTPPWNAMAFAATSPTFTARDVLRMDARAALPLLDVSVPDVYERLDHEDAAHFLERIRFPPAARDLAFSVFSRSFFADPRDLSAAELATMFHLYFLGSSDGLPFDVPSAPFPQAVWDPLAGYLERLGVDIRTGSAVARIGRSCRFTVEAEAGLALTVDAVVLAADVDGLRGLVARSPDLGDPAWRERVAALRTAPPFLVTRLWLDRPVDAGRPAFVGTAGFGRLDNVSVLDRYEDEARVWAGRTGGSVVELHAYALPAGADPAAVRAELVDHLRRVYPETAAASVVDERTELRADCPLFPPGGFSGRPGVATPDPCLVLAGDLVRVDLPVALMERAATSGLLAANLLLHRWGLPGHLVRSVPNHGRWRVFRTLARRWAR
jgi:uncharacterized protein with NAD-binding domain and iron-sulfur cluster/ubiquinone/menaquinone biosynthesis C-methylase UbiE